MDITVTEIDDYSANDISSLHMPYNSLPTFENKAVTRYTMQRFIKENAKEQAIDHDGCFTFEFEVSAGLGAKSGKADLGVGVSAGFKYENCSTWTEVPGGYNVHMSVYTPSDPSYDLAYSLVSNWYRA